MEKHHKLGSDASPFLQLAEKYKRIVRRLIYLSTTRPDISYSVYVLAQFMQTPREAQWDATLSRTISEKVGWPRNFAQLKS